MAGWWLRVLGVALALAGVVTITPAQAPGTFGPPTDRVIIRFKAEHKGCPSAQQWMGRCSPS